MQPDQFAFFEGISRSEHMIHLLKALSGAKVAVIGDLMLDCYLLGSVERISPEAPVPVLQVQSQRDVPGGAANVATNVSALGLSVRLVGVAGDDHDRSALFSALQDRGIDRSHIVIDPTRRTTRKLRVVGSHQQIVRIDQEDVKPLSSQIELNCIASAKRAIAEADVVIVSDYGKGVCTPRLLSEVFHAAAERGKPVIVDPKQKDLSIYRGASILTPNRKELAEAVFLPCDSDEDISHAVAEAQRACPCDILLTRSEKGMSYFPIDGVPHHFATAAQDVFDVSGAGDTVVAGLAAGLAVGATIYDSIRMANHAAGIAVSKFGTASITLDELAAAMVSDDAQEGTETGHLVTAEEAVHLRQKWARQHLTVGVANGCFDLLHPGHVALIREAAANCDRLIVAINADESVRRLKGAGRPVQDEHSRAAVVGAIRGVAAVVVFRQDTPLELFTALRPDLIVKGSDYAEKEVVGADLVKARGGRVLLVDLVRDQSTSQIVARASVHRTRETLSA